MDKFGDRFRARFRPIHTDLVDKGKTIPTGWGQWGQPLLDAALPGFGATLAPVQPGTIQARECNPRFPQGQLPT